MKRYEVQNQSVSSLLFWAANSVSSKFLKNIFLLSGGWTIEVFAAPCVYCMNTDKCSWVVLILNHCSITKPLRKQFVFFLRNTVIKKGFFQLIPKPHRTKSFLKQKITRLRIEKVLSMGLEWIAFFTLFMVAIHKKQTFSLKIYYQMFGMMKIWKSAIKLQSV